VAPRAVFAGLLGILSLSAPLARAEPASTAGAPPLEAGQHFTLDPVADGVLTAGGLGFAFLLGEVLGTGEIKPPTPVAGVTLLPIDRSAITQTIDPHASTYSNIGLYTAIGFAALDPVLSGFRDGTDALVVDAFMYAESGSLALTLTDITKIAVRRPRPIDYKNCEPLASGGEPSGCTSTDLGLSFWSGHAAGVAAIGATATYLAFIRDPGSPRPWITLGAATALTAFVSYERVRAGEHFPTDVIAGSMAGAAIGVLVPHLHRHPQEAPHVWVGVGPSPSGGSLSLQGLF
jgi:undecaprenyl-diphosphatase